MSKFKNSLLAAVGLLLLSNLLLLTQRTTVQAQSPGSSLANLITTVNTLKAQVAADDAKITTLQTTTAAQAGTLTLLQQVTTNQEVQISALQTANGTLQALTAPMTLSGTDLTFTGVNVHIVNGMGGTETANGLGNLILGYGESRAGIGLSGDVRTGSHNLVTGIYNNYGSFGGIVGGYGNSLSGGEEFAVGALNTVTGNQACVTGGISNTATGDYASVLGGTSNTAVGNQSVVVAGESNKSQGLRDVVVSGYGSTSDGTDSVVVGGYENYTYNHENVVSGGAKNSVTSISDGSVSGGFNITVIGDGQWAAGNGQAAADAAVRAALFAAN